MIEPGTKYGRWTVGFYSHSVKYPSGNHRYYKCVCECGGIGLISEKALKRGTSRSCGCLRVEMLKARKKTI